MEHTTPLHPTAGLNHPALHRSTLSMARLPGGMLTNGPTGPRSSRIALCSGNTIRHERALDRAILSAMSLGALTALYFPVAVHELIP